MKSSLAFRMVLGSAILWSTGFLVAGIDRAQQIPESLYSEMQWRMIGPFRAGKVNAVAGVPGNPGVYYFGADGALALAPSNPNIIYVGTGTNTISGDTSYGDGVYKSLDGGENWQHIGLEDTRHIGRILVDPRNPDVVLVAAMGHSSGPNEERGVFRLRDGGRSWKKVLYRDNVTGAADLCCRPEGSNIRARQRAL